MGLVLSMFDGDRARVDVRLTLGREARARDEAQDRSKGPAAMTSRGYVTECERVREGREVCKWPRCAGVGECACSCSRAQGLGDVQTREYARSTRVRGAERVKKWCRKRCTP